LYHKSAKSCVLMNVETAVLLSVLPIFFKTVQLIYFLTGEPKIVNIKPHVGVESELEKLIAYGSICSRKTTECSLDCTISCGEKAGA